MYDFSRYLNIRSAVRPVPTADAKYVAYLSDITGNFQVWKTGLKEFSSTAKIPRQLTFFDEKIWEIHGSPTTNHIVAVGDVGGNERQQLYLISHNWDDGHEVSRLTTNDEAIHRFGKWNKDGQRIVYTSNARNNVDFDVYQLDIKTGVEELLFQCSGNRTIVAWSPDGDYLLLREAVSSLQHELYEVRIENGRESHLTANVPPARYEQIHWVEFDLYVITDREDDCGALCRFHRGTGELIVLVDSTIEETPGELECFAVSPNGRRAALTYNADGDSLLYMLDLTKEIDTENLKPCKSVAAGVISHLHFSRDSWYLYFDQQRPHENPNIWRLDCDKPDEFLACYPITLSDKAGTRRASFVTPELIRYKSFDDLEIPAFYYQPQTEAPDGGYPCILYVHGGPASQQRPDFDVRFQFFLSRGYAILATNVRGSTGYGRAYAELDEIELRMDSVADLKYAAHWLQGQEEINGERIAIYGRSYGGFMVLAALTEYPDLFAAGIDVVGIANWVTFMERTSVIYWNGYRRSTK